MAVTITHDFTVLTTCDTATGAANLEASNVKFNAVNIDIKVQGTASWEGRTVVAGLGGLGFDLATNQDLSDNHVFVWARSLDKVDTLANGGWRIRVSSTNGAADADYGEWYTSGQETNRVVIGGYALFAADTTQPFDATLGIVPPINSLAMVGVIANHITFSGRFSFYLDEFKYGTGITIKGGTVGTPGTLAEVATEDETAGRGVFKSIRGSFYVLGRLTFGDITAATTSVLEDTNTVIIFEDQNVSSTFHKMEFVGGTGTNRVTFGTGSGTGTAKEGSGGITCVAAGVRPFRVEAIDADITVEFFGCSFTNSAALREDAFRDFVGEDNSLTTFVNDTRDANDIGVNDAAVLSAASDAAYFGHDERFSLLKINTGTAVTGTPTVVWEYSNGSTWTALTDITDGTTSFTTTGLQTVSYSIPDDWATQAVTSGGTRYWIRGRFSVAGTATGQITQCFASMSGGMRWEQTNAEAIRCVFTNMGTIRLRNGAFLKKCIITDSVEPAKSAAIDLGSADPTADTFRDCTIQNCTKGILLKGTSTGTTTYNFRNLQFAGNTKDVRVDFPGAATVVINILEGGNTPTVDNVNTSTVTINNAVTLTVHVEDNNEANLQGAQVYMQKSSPTAFTSGAGNNAADGDLVVTQTIDSDIPQAGTCIVFDKSLNATLPYRFASHDGANTFTFPTEVTGSATSAGTSTSLISTSTNFLTADIEEGDTIRNTTDGSFAVIDRIIDADNITTSDLQGGTDNTWQSSDAFSLHKLATTLASGIDTVDVPLINGQTDASGDITLSYNFGTNTAVFVRVRKNSSEFTTKFQPGRATGTIVSTGITVNITLQEDTVAV